MNYNYRFVVLILLCFSAIFCNKSLDTMKLKHNNAEISPLNFWITQHILRQNIITLNKLIDFPGSPITAACFSPDDHLLILGNHWGNLYLYNIEDDVPYLIRSWKVDQRDPIHWIHFDNNGKLFAVVTQNMMLAMTIDSTEPLASIQHCHISNNYLYHEGVVSIDRSYSLESNYTDIWKWNLRSSKPVQLASLPGSVSLLELSASEKYMLQVEQIYQGYYNIYSIVSLLDLAGKPQISFNAPPYRHTTLCLNNGIVTAGGNDYPHQEESIEWWDKQGNLLKQLKTYGMVIKHLYCNDKHSHLLSVDSEKMNYIMWDATAMSPMLHLQFFRETLLACNHRLTMFISRPSLFSNGFSGFRLTRLITKDMEQLMETVTKNQLQFLHAAHQALLKKDRSFELYGTCWNGIAQTLPISLQETIMYVLADGPLPPTTTL